MLKATAVQRISVRFARWNMFGRGSSKADMYEVPEESSEMEDYQRQIENLEKEARNEYIESKRNKSRLSASHRQILQGKHPFDGVIFEYGDVHRSRKFKREMFGRYGTKTGIDPGILWPTDKDIDLAKEWESLYQPAPLRQMIDQTLKEEEDNMNRKIERERKIEENLSKLDAQIAAWNNRVNAKNRLAEGERLRREKVLAELKAEFGYDINPNDEIMKTRIAEREKVLIKEERELKKLLRKEKMEREKEDAKR